MTLKDVRRWGPFTRDVVLTFCRVLTPSPVTRFALSDRGPCNLFLHHLFCGLDPSNYGHQLVVKLNGKRKPGRSPSFPLSMDSASTQSPIRTMRGILLQIVFSWVDDILTSHFLLSRRLVPRGANDPGCRCWPRRAYKKRPRENVHSVLHLIGLPHCPRATGPISMPHNLLCERILKLHSDAHSSQKRAGNVIFQAASETR